MITEDYVSFETAKLLKEKGFDWECIGYYVDDEPNDVKYSLIGETNSIWESRCCSAPTLQMAMKWLREVYNFYIDIRININNSLYSFKIYSVGVNGARAFTDYRIKSYEQACEAAIKYCLENLI